MLFLNSRVLSAVAKNAPPIATTLAPIAFSPLPTAEPMPAKLFDSSPYSFADFSASLYACLFSSKSFDKSSISFPSAFACLLFFPYVKTAFLYSSFKSDKVFSCSFIFFDNLPEALSAFFSSLTTSPRLSEYLFILDSVFLTSACAFANLDCNVSNSAEWSPSSFDTLSISA